MDGEQHMSDLREAAERALKALGEYTSVVTSGTDPTKWDEVVDCGGPAREAIQALSQALNQPDYRDKDIADLTKACQVLLRENLRLQEELNK